MIKLLYFTARLISADLTKDIYTWFVNDKYIRNMQNMSIV